MAFRCRIESCLCACDLALPAPPARCYVSGSLEKNPRHRNPNPNPNPNPIAFSLGVGGESRKQTRSWFPLSAHRRASAIKCKRLAAGSDRGGGRSLGFALGETGVGWRARRRVRRRQSFARRRRPTRATNSRGRRRADEERIRSERKRELDCAPTKRENGQTRGEATKDKQ